MATITQNYGTPVVLTVTNLQSLASSATAGWQSVLVSNLVTKAIDYEIYVKLTAANTAPANDKAAYVYICPFFYDGAAWNPTSQGTTTLPTGIEGTTTIASPNSLRLLAVMPYTTQQMIMQKVCMLSEIFQMMPDGFSIIIINFSGAALATACVVDYTPIKQDIA